MTIIESRVIPEEPTPSANLEATNCQNDTLTALQHNVSTQHLLHDALVCLPYHKRHPAAKDK